MSASEDHASAVATALAEAETLAGEAERNLKAAVEAASAGVIAVIDQLAATVETISAQAANAEAQTQATLGAAEQHVSATTAAGQGTLGHVLAAQEACQYAASNATGVTEFLGNLGGAVQESQNTAVTSLLSLLGQLDDGITGAKATVGHLEEAQTQIAQAQSPR